MSITVALLQFYARYAEPTAVRGGAGHLSGDDLQEVEATVGPILRELEELRQATLRKIDRRAIWMLPAGILAGAVLWTLLVQDSSILALFVYVVVGGTLGWSLAFTSLNKAYRTAYKTLIVPHLAARFGDLSYRPAHEPDLDRLAMLGIIPRFGKKCVEDEVYGTYRGVRLNIVEANLETGGKNSRVVFNGLLVEVGLPDAPNGTTLVVKDGGMLANAIAAFARDSGLERVRLEDPRFEGVYQVYSDDQIAARALLTPAVMERLMRLEDVAGEPPRLIAERGVLRIAVATGPKENFFEPPSIADPVRGGDQLLHLSADIGSVLKLIDAVLAISPRTRVDDPAPSNSRSASAAQGRDR